MAVRCLSGCFAFYIVLSLLTHVAELVTNGILVYHFFVSESIMQNWFSLVMGILLIPLVLIQLLSAILLLSRRANSLTTCDAVSMAFLHIVQLGFIWRHFSVLKERDILVKKAEMAELFLLRMTYAFGSGFPLLLVHTFLILDGVSPEIKWILYAAAIASLLSTTWSLSSFRRQHETCDTEDIVLTWPGSVFKLVWRAGEITSRVISLALFASLYSHWMFLVIGLHWITMLVCVCTAVFNAVSSETSNSKAYKISFRVLVAYMYIFAFINFSNQNAMLRYVMYYVIMFLENVTLCLIWMLQDAAGESKYRFMIIFIVATCFFLSVLSMTIYYRCFHMSISDVPSDAKSLVCVKEASCINCKLSLCVKHKLKLQRPFSAGWYSQYNEAVYHGNYYKNLMHDSLLDSAPSDYDSKSIRSIFMKPGTISEESNTSVVREADHVDLEKRSVVSFQSAGTYMHKRYMNADVNDIIDDDLHSDNTSMPGSLIGLDRNDIHVLSESSLSAGSAKWITPAGRSASQTCLLTDTWDSISQLNSDPGQDHYPNLPSCRSLLRDDHHWYSDGYTTDNTTLEWSKLTITNLSAKRPVVSDSESEYYCHCNNLDIKQLMGGKNVAKSKKESYANWSRKREALKKERGFAIDKRPRGVSSLKLSKLDRRNDRVPAWVIDTTDKLVSQNFEQWSTTIGAVNSVKPKMKSHAPFFDIAEECARKQRVDNSSSEAYHSMAGHSENDREHYVKGRRRSHHNVRRHRPLMTDSESETNYKIRARRSRSAGPKLEFSTVNQSKKQKRYSKQTHQRNSTDKTTSPQNVHLHSKSPINISTPLRAFPVLNTETPTSGVRNIRATSKDKSKMSIDSGICGPDYENEYVAMNSSIHRKKVENVYENQAYIGDGTARNSCNEESDEVFSQSVVTPWYVCSESEDSALPQETLSSSNCALTVSDHESDDSLELII